MYVAIQSAIVVGVNGVGITVEVDISNGLPQIQVVGLPDSAIRESIERVRSAIRNSGFQFPLERITINLAPAALRKEGTGLDLAIAVAILKASGQLEGNFERTLIVGELALNGTIRAINGALALLEFAKQSGYERIILPSANQHEACLISNLKLGCIAHIHELKSMQYHHSDQLIIPSSSSAHHSEHSSIDIADIVGQHEAKRALLIAASGKHNMIVTGPPGVGKTMLMRRLPTILPQLNEQEALEVLKIQSVAGKLQNQHSFLNNQPPFRAPHHSTSTAGLIGGGSSPKPGEVTLAHHGILFLDELPEFSRQVLELLRQPLEQQNVTISRARQHITFPASFMLVASCNPCPCGYFGYETEATSCSCSHQMIQRYRNKLSGPLLDRIDIQLDMTRPLSITEDNQQQALTSDQLKDTVLAVREIQQFRYRGESYHYNSELTSSGLKKYAALSDESDQLLEQSFKQLGMSMRGYMRIIKIARTIADLDQSASIQLQHIAEAIQYRKLDLFSVAKVQ